MSYGNRGFIAALAGLALLASFIAYGLNEQLHYYEDAQARTSNYAAYSSDQIQQTCAGVAVAKKAGCLREAITKYRLQNDDNQRDYADLVAQQTSALWTEIMGIAALIGMALSVAGIWLINATFLQTRNQAKEAAASNIFARFQDERANAPKLFVRTLEGPVTVIGGNATFDLTGLITNQAQIEARQIRLGFKLLWGEHLAPLNEISEAIEVEQHGDLFSLELHRAHEISFESTAGIPVDLANTAGGIIVYVAVRAKYVWGADSHAEDRIAILPMVPDGMGWNALVDGETAFNKQIVRGEFQSA